MNQRAKPPLISIVTPCFNAERYIGETMLSVVNNSVFLEGSADLQYLIQDGGSTDDTCSIVTELISRHSRPNIQIGFSSKADHGMYDALSQGLRQVRGEICAYINAGDFYSPTAFEIAIEVFKQPGVFWLTGLQVRYNEKSHLLSANLPYRYRGRLCRSGVYGRTLPFIQQESTFWHGSLTRLVDLERLSAFRYAGDFYLWKCFAESHQLFIAEAWLGGFKVHQNQLSDDKKAYFSELSSVAEKRTIAVRLQSMIDALIWHSPNRIKRYFNRDTLFSFDFAAQAYRLDVSNFGSAQGR